MIRVTRTSQLPACAIVHRCHVTQPDGTITPEEYHFEPATADAPGAQHVLTPAQAADLQGPAFARHFTFEDLTPTPDAAAPKKKTPSPTA